MLWSLDNTEILQAIQFSSLTSNNEAEYKALLVGLHLTLDLFVTHFKVYSDS